MIRKLKADFKSGRLDKQDYILRMFEHHELLLEYSDFLSGTDISKIEILPGEGLVFTTRPHGIRLCCNKNDRRAAPFEILNFDGYERGDSQMMQGLIERDFTVLDIGANIGWYSMNIARNLAGGKMLSFEPVPETHHCLCRNVRLNGFENIEVHNLGLHEQEGEFVFYVSGDTAVSSSLTNITHDQNAVAVTCRVTTLDKFAVEHSVSKIDFIKCDVEGAELLVFKGGAAVIDRHRPVVFSEMLRKWSAEFGYHPNDIINFFAGLGYACFYCRDGKLVPILNVDERTEPTNFFFLHQKKHGDLIRRYA